MSHPIPEQTLQPAYPCWSCRQLVTETQRAESDGFCPHCNAELDSEDWPCQAAPCPVTDEQLLELADQLEAATHRMHSQAYGSSRKAVRFLRYLAEDRTVDENDAGFIRKVIDELNRFSQAVSDETCKRMLNAANALRSCLPA